MLVRTSHSSYVLVDDEPVFLVSADVEEESPSCDSGLNLSKESDQNQMVTLSTSPSSAVEVVPPESTSPGVDGAVSQSER